MSDEIVGQIKQLELREKALTRKQARLFPKYEKIEREYSEVSSELEKVQSTLKMVRKAIASALGVATAEPAPVAKPPKGSVTEEILAFLRENGESTATRVAKGTGCSNASAYLVSLVKRGLVGRTKRAEDKPFIYFNVVK